MGKNVSHSRNVSSQKQYLEYYYYFHFYYHYHYCYHYFYYHYCCLLFIIIIINHYHYYRQVVTVIQSKCLSSSKQTNCSLLRLTKKRRLALCINYIHLITKYNSFHKHTPLTTWVPFDFSITHFPPKPA